MWQSECLPGQTSTPFQGSRPLEPNTLSKMFSEISKVPPCFCFSLTSLTSMTFGIDSDHIVMLQNAILDLLAAAKVENICGQWETWRDGKHGCRHQPVEIEIKKNLNKLNGFFFWFVRIGCCRQVSHMKRITSKSPKNKTTDDVITMKLWFMVFTMEKRIESENWIHQSVIKRKCYFFSILPNWSMF